MSCLPARLNFIFEINDSKALIVVLFQSDSF
jgi:hypothetical protein